MKKVFYLLTVLIITSCSKNKFENKIQGDWIMKEGKVVGASSWHEFPNTESPVSISDSHISNPWNTEYTIKGNVMFMNSQIVIVDIKKDNMLWVFENNDSLRFIR